MTSELILLLLVAGTSDEGAPFSPIDGRPAPLVCRPVDECRPPPPHRRVLAWSSSHWYIQTFQSLDLYADGSAVFKLTKQNLEEVICYRQLPRHAVDAFKKRVGKPPPEALRKSDHQHPNVWNEHIGVWFHDETFWKLDIDKDALRSKRTFKRLREAIAWLDEQICRGECPLRLNGEEILDERKRRGLKTDWPP